MNLGPQIEDLTGQIFGQLTVIEYAGKNQRGKTQWKCRCTCGNEVTVRSCNLKAGTSSSCGCSRKTHGLSRTHVHGCWRSMIDRCTRNRNIGFHRYKGRGIQVCDRWKSFESFLDDMGMPPSDKHQIDRINNNGPYEPCNCRWVLPREQGRNRNNNRILIYNGRSFCLTELAEHAGMNLSTLSTRLRNGMSVEDAVEIPLQPGRRL